jgi:hypothetical protein
MRSMRLRGQPDVSGACPRRIGRAVPLHWAHEQNLGFRVQERKLVAEHCLPTAYCLLPTAYSTLHSPPAYAIHLGQAT